jgi:hypothetical protein
VTDEILAMTPGEVFAIANARIGYRMELLKRSAHLIAALSGFKTVKSYEETFPTERKKPLLKKKGDLGKFFARIDQRVKKKA